MVAENGGVRFYRKTVAINPGGVPIPFYGKIGHRRLDLLLRRPGHADQHAQRGGFLRRHQDQDAGLVVVAQIGEAVAAIAEAQLDAEAADLIERLVKQVAHLTQAKQAANLATTGSRISRTKTEAALEQVANLPPGAVGQAGAIARAALAEGAVPACPAVSTGMPDTAPTPP